MQVPCQARKAVAITYTAKLIFSGLSVFSIAQKEKQLPLSDSQAIQFGQRSVK